MSDLAVSKSSISQNTASELIRAAVEHAGRIGLPVSVAVVDDAGHLKAFARMDAAYLGSVQIAQDKAYSAVLMLRPTGAWPAILSKDPALEQGLPRAADRLVTFGGGIPVTVEGQVVGAIGISGGHYTQDVEVAEAALTAVVGQPD